MMSMNHSLCEQLVLLAISQGQWEKDEYHGMGHRNDSVSGMTHECRFERGEIVEGPVALSLLSIVRPHLPDPAVEAAAAETEAETAVEETAAEEAGTPEPTPMPEPTPVPQPLEVMAGKQAADGCVITLGVQLEVVEVEEEEEEEVDPKAKRKDDGKKEAKKGGGGEADVPEPEVCAHAPPP